MTVKQSLVRSRARCGPHRLNSTQNLSFHIRGALKVNRRIPSGHPMKRYYFGFAAVSVNAWIWSSVFHTRGPPFL